MLFETVTMKGPNNIDEFLDYKAAVFDKYVDNLNMFFPYHYFIFLKFYSLDDIL